MSTAMATAAAVAAEILLRVPVAPAALPHQVTAGDLTYDCLAATGRACPLTARDGTGLLEIVRRADGTLQARLVASAQLPRNAPLVVAGVVREADAHTGRAVVGGYRVDFTPLMHDAAARVPVNGELVRVTARVAGPKTLLPALTLQGITGSARAMLQGITGSAGPTLQGITGSAGPALQGITGSAGPTLQGITGSAKVGQ